MWLSCHLQGNLYYFIQITYNVTYSLTYLFFISDITDGVDKIVGNIRKDWAFLDTIPEVKYEPEKWNQVYIYTHLHYYLLLLTSTYLLTYVLIGNRNNEK